ncbi:MAG: nitroreductase family deazaflavin-dependent oxidoreductase [Actinomycetota bacterium]|nr:nitroreductase family deazaflavin-dependent oxidoreductase [Actinomycetota bacterium]
MTEEQRKAYLEGHRRNPLTTTPVGARILSASQLPWFTLIPPAGFGVLTTTGRKSGAPRRKCVRAIRSGDCAYLVALVGSTAAWLLNLKANPRVRLRIRGGTFDGTAREITDPAERAEAKEVYAGAVNPFDRLEYLMHRPGRPTPERIRELHAKWFTDGTPVVVDLSGATRRRS